MKRRPKPNLKSIPENALTLEQQIEYYRAEAEIMNLNTNRYLSWAELFWNIVKSLVLGLAAAVAFFLVSRPDSVISKKGMQESIQRERAKMMLDLLKEKDPEKVSLGFKVLERAYKDDKKWIEQIRREFNAITSADRIASLRKDFNQTLTERTTILAALNKERNATMSDKERIGELTRQFLVLDAELKEITELIKLTYSISP